MKILLPSFILSFLWTFCFVLGGEGFGGATGVRKKTAKEKGEKFIATLSTPFHARSSSSFSPLLRISYRMYLTVRSPSLFLYKYLFLSF